MKFKLEITTDNAAFADGNAGTEVARIITAVARNLEGRFLKIDGRDSDVLRDSNGNTVGRAYSEGADTAPDGNQYTCADCGNTFDSGEERDDHFMSPNCGMQGMYDMFGKHDEDYLEYDLQIIRQAQRKAMETFQMTSSVDAAAQAAAKFFEGEDCWQSTPAKIAKRIAKQVVKMLTHDIAVEFVGRLKDDGIDLKRVDSENKTIARGCCASHDQCDANVYMAEAFDLVMGRELTMGDKDEALQEADATLWSNAWDVAKRTGFVKLAKESHAG